MSGLGVMLTEKGGEYKSNMRWVEHERSSSCNICRRIAIIDIQSCVSHLQNKAASSRSGSGQTMPYSLWNIKWIPCPVGFNQPGLYHTKADSKRLDLLWFHCCLTGSLSVLRALECFCNTSVKDSREKNVTINIIKHMSLMFTFTYFGPNCKHLVMARCPTESHER